MSVPRWIDFAPEFTNAVRKLYKEVGTSEGDRLLQAIRVEAVKLQDIEWSNLPDNVTATSGNRQYRCAFGPEYAFTFRRESKRQSHKVVEEWIWLDTIEKNPD